MNGNNNHDNSEVATYIAAALVFASLTLPLVSGYFNSEDKPQQKVNLRAGNNGLAEVVGDGK